MSELAVSRRTVTCALATLPAIAIPSLAAATSRAVHQGDEPMNMITNIKTQPRSFDPRSRDQDFWETYDAWKSLERQWLALQHDDDAMAQRCFDLTMDMIDKPISTVAALAIKFDTISEFNDNRWSAGVSLHQRVMWDAERIAKLEMFGDAATSN